MTDLFVLLGDFVARLDPLTLGVTTVVVLLILTYKTVTGLFSLWKTLRQERKRYEEVVEIEAEDTLKDDEIKISKPLFKRMPWINSGDPVHVISEFTKSSILFDSASRRNVDDPRKIYVSQKRKLELQGIGGGNPRLQFRHSAPLSPYQHLKFAIQSPARRSEFILGFWFVLLSLSLEMAFGIL